MKRRLWITAVLLAMGALTGCAAREPVATASPTVEAASTMTPTPAPLVTPSPTPVPMDVLYDIIVHPPTCQANGYSVYINRESGGINIRDEVPRLSHEWIEQDGKTVCKNCGIEKNAQN